MLIKAFLVIATLLIIMNVFIMQDAQNRIACLKQTEGKEERC